MQLNLIDSSPVTSSISSTTQEFLKDSGNERKQRTAAAAAAPSENNSISDHASSSSSTKNERPLAEVISEKFPPFDAAMYIVSPFSAEAARDVTADEEYTTMLLDAVIQTHAWATSRVKRKNQLECQKLEEQNHRIMKTEKEQGMCSPTPSSSTSVLSLSSSVSKFRYGAIGIVEKAREGLADFVTKMKQALAALTGVGA